MAANATHLMIETISFIDGDLVGDAFLPAPFRSIDQVGDETSCCDLPIPFLQMGQHLRHHGAGMGGGWIADEIDQMERINSLGYRIKSRSLPRS